MLEEKDSNINKKTIYIQLFDEGTSVIRPTEAIEIGNGLFKVLATPNYDISGEIWEFLPGTIVTCEIEKKDGEEILIAKKQIDLN